MHSASVPRRAILASHHKGKIVGAVMHSTQLKRLEAAFQFLTPLQIEMLVLGTEQTAMVQSPERPQLRLVLAPSAIQVFGKVRASTS
jgi:hypothetical protein